MSVKSARMRSSNSSCAGLPDDHGADQTIEVCAGREVAACAGEDRRSDVRVVVDQIPRVAQPAQHFGVEGVALLGTIEGDGHDVAVAFHEHSRFGHAQVVADRRAALPRPGGRRWGIRWRLCLRG